MDHRLQRLLQSSHRFGERSSSRRSFLRRSAATVGGLAASTLMVDLAGCRLPIEAGPASQTDVLLGLYDRESFSDPVLAAKAAFEKMDLSWLGAGESVLLKVASNSGNVHPAVTAPSSVQGVARALFEAGAGRVVVADQAGVQQVRLVEGERRFSSTRAMFERNGLLAAAEAEEAEVHFFDDQGFADGYFEAALPADFNWQQPMMLPNVVRDVDHIVYLPRISSHLLAGYTHGTKMAIGWLRDDSRRYLHHDAATFYEKYTEINFVDEIRSRHRLTFSFAESLLLHQGPDFGTIAVADPMIAIGSSNIAHHDALAVAVLTLFDQNTPPEIDGVAYGAWADIMNFAFLNVVVEEDTGIPWGPGEDSMYTSYVPHGYQLGVGRDRALTRAYELQGGRPASVPVRFDGVRPSDVLQQHLSIYSEELLDLSALS